MGKIKPGAVIEIHTSKGLAYAQYTHLHDQYGHLLRVFNKQWPARPDNLRELVQVPADFVTFFPLGAAVRRKIVAIVDHAEIPADAQSFPIFRSGLPDPVTRRVAVWWLWDGKNAWRVGELTAEQRRLPLGGVINDTLLIERIEESWTSEKDPM